MGKGYYITTPIFYPNDIPHIGTAYNVIASDILARFARITNKDVFFLTGTDEHGQKIEQAANSRNQSPKEYVDKIVDGFKTVWEKLNISYDDFIRTTEKRHITVVQKVFKRLMETGDIKKGFYEGWYCVPDETFWLESQLIDNKCPNQECRRPVEWVKEESYFFTLSKYAESLLSYIESNPDFIMPLSRRNETISFIKNGLQDLCVTRKTLKWGVPVPEDPEHVLYVWIDALINYISAIGYLVDENKFNKWWPADLHLIGKDILRFHAIIWPAMLMALNIPLPKTIFAHGWLSIGGEKISKSKGVKKNLLELIDEYGTDPLRYFLLREGSFGHDFEFSEEALIRRINTELANDLGNLFHRTLTMIEKYQNSQIFEPNNKSLTTAKDDEQLKETANKLFVLLKQDLAGLLFRQGIIDIWNLVDLANKYVDSQAPWTLNKKGETERLKTVLYNLAETLRIIALAVSPFLPQSAEKMLKQLGLQYSISSLSPEDFSWGKLPAGAVAKGVPLFPKIEEASIA